MMDTDTNMMVGVFTIAKWELLRSRLDLSTRSLIAGRFRRCYSGDRVVCITE
ncbi:MAG: hypothetical protein U9N43_07975 [Euryarchaeota archaeon]|nr:hypothetical protein [Euryarchaeota archaeon]